MHYLMKDSSKNYASSSSSSSSPSPSSSSSPSSPSASSSKSSSPSSPSNSSSSSKSSSSSPSSSSSASASSSAAPFSALSARLELPFAVFCFFISPSAASSSNDRFWPLRSSAVGASAGAASVFTSSDIFIRFFGIGFELTNFRRRSLNWKAPC